MHAQALVINTRAFTEHKRLRVFAKEQEKLMKEGAFVL